MKVLLSAFACRPNWGSEPEVGWNWVREISRFAEVHVITPTLNRKPLFRELENAPLPNVKWVFVPTHQKMHETNRLQYYLWQRKVYRAARELHDQVGFDLCQHLTYCVYWLPSGLAKVGIPFVWGPVGGGEQADIELARSLPLANRMKHKLRRTVQRTAEKDPWLRATARAASVALATTEDTAARLRLLGARRVQVLPSVSLSAEDYAALSAIPVRNESPARLVSIGRLLHWKGFDLGLEAFARIAADFPEAEYWIVGDGSDRIRLEKCAEAVGIQDRVVFTGYRERSQVLRDLAACDVMVHPSMHDSGGWVTLEAMAAGRPVVCLDSGGPAMQVRHGETGFKVKPGPHEQVVARLADALRTLLSDPQTRIKMGAAARAFVYQNYHSQTGRRIEAIYEKVLESRSTDRKSEPRSA